ncbi:MAG: fructosamine kinase family protein [Polyangiales bacterium]
MTPLQGGLRAAIESALSEEISAATPVRGGDINDAFRLRLSSGETVFAKVNPNAPEGMFASEVHGLGLLRSGPLHVPAMLAQHRDFLLLEDLGAGAPSEEHDEALGHGLAALHQVRSELAGCERRRGFIATLDIDNDQTDWTTFYLRRLQSLFERSGLDATWRLRFDALRPRVRSLLEDAPIALLHGDLWSGNVHTGRDGDPCLVDPSAYYGDPEVDLGMMHLFGGFSPRVFDAYDEGSPPRTGRSVRRVVYQLYPVLVHLLLFGQGYEGQLDSLLRQLE